MSLITIQQFSLPSDNLADGNSYVLRLWYNQGFLDSSGQAVAPGTSTTGTYLTTSATVAGGFITFDPFAVYTTLDAEVPNPQSIGIQCQLFKGNSSLPINPFNQNGTPNTWIVPDDLGGTISFEDWTIANQRIVLANPPQTLYTAAQVDALIAANDIQVAFNQDYVISAYATFAAAVAAATVTGGTLVINQSTTTSNQTVPANVTLRFTRKGSITVNPTTTLTIVGPVEADPVRIFFGTGTVSFTGNVALTAVYPNWWGNNTVPGTTNMGTAITAAMTAAATCSADVAIVGGLYAYSTAPNLGIANVTVRSDGAVNLKHTGSGAILQVGPVGSGVYNANIIGDFTVTGNAASSSAGIVLEGIAQSRIELKCGGAPGAAFTIKGAEKASFDLVASWSALPGAAWPAGLTPTKGVVVDSGAGFGRTTNCNFHVIAEAVSTRGLDVVAADSCIFTGTSEGNGSGLIEAANCLGNTYNAFYFDVNSVVDADIAGTGALFTEVVAKTNTITPNILIDGTGKGVSFNGGYIRSIDGTAGITPKFTAVRTSPSPLGIIAPQAIWDATCAYVDGNGLITSYYSDYRAPTLLNSWVNFGSGYSVAGYQKSDGIVRLKGLIKSGTTTGGTVLFTLPSGFRPAATLQFMTEANSTLAVLEILSTGDVTIAVVGSSAFLTLSGISFVAEG
jgi:hypothetical protein